MRDPDAGLIREIAQGNEASFTRLVKRYQNRVLSTIYRYVQDSSVAQDLAQEVFIKVWENARTFKGKSRFSTWLYRIVVNHCLSYHSKRERHQTVELEESLTDHGLSVQGKARKDVERELLKEAMEKLSSRQRIALILFKFEGYSCKEVAGIMGISFPAAQSLIFRAIDALRKKLVPLREKGLI